MADATHKLPDGSRVELVALIPGDGIYRADRAVIARENGRTENVLAAGLEIIEDQDQDQDQENGDGEDAGQD